jgi:uncharacterized repeat protein (TIGR03803 family)
MRRVSFALIVALTLTYGVVSVQAQSATEQLIYIFCQQSDCADGSQPTYGMALLSNGSFVVATDGSPYNGTNGSLVMLTPVIQGNYSANVIAEFCYGSFTVCTNGNFPSGTPIEALNGDIYFSNLDGGLTSYTPGPGSGTLFQLSPPYTDSTLSDFFLFCSDSNCAAGGNPMAGLIQGADGDLYGTTSDSPADSGSGSIFRIDSSANVTALYNFCSLASCADGGGVTAPLLQAADGNFYGTTQGGGANDYGVVFRWNAKGFYSVLHSFCTGGTGCPDGATPVGALVQADNGNIYGVTAAGGNSSNGGTIFYIDSTGTFHTWLDFGCILGGTLCVNGYTPGGGLIQASDGKLYGTTTATSSRLGGPEYGAAFQLSLNDTNAPATNIYYYCVEGDPCLDSGSSPSGELVVGADANLYGVVTSGADNGQGAAYALTTTSWLEPPVQLTFSSSSVAANSPVTLSWSVPYAYSKTAQLCGAFIQNSPTGAGSWTGQQTGSYANHAYSGSSVITPTAEGTYTYALTCGGKESGFAILTVTAPLKTTTTTALTAAPNPAIVGQTVTLKATVTGTGATPTGSIGFTFNGSSLGAISLNGSGVASTTVSTSGLAPGGYSAVATYAGDSTHDSSVSSTVTVTVSKAGSSTALSASPNPVTPGQSVSLKATVTGASGIPTGSVSFTFNGTALGSVSLNGSGVATTTASTTGLAPGKYSAVATYAGSSTYAASTAPTVTVTINAANSTTLLSISPAAPTVGQSATIKATVTGESGTPTGTVTFSADGVTLGSASLNGSGVASFTASTNGLPPSTYPVTARYSGNSSYNSSQSSTVNVKLGSAPTSTTLSVSPTSVTPPADITLTATVVRSASGASGLPTGNVTFSVGTDILAIVGLNAKGIASLTAPSQGYPAGSYPVKAVYSGDSGDSTSTSSAVTVTLK